MKNQCVVCPRELPHPLEFPSLRVRCAQAFELAGTGAKTMIVTCGDAVIDLMPEPVPGGSNVNVAVAAARLGGPTAYLGRISVDGYGDILMRHLEESGVDTHLVERGTEPTARAIVTLDPAPSFRFEADNTAEANLSVADLSPLGPGPHIVHGGTFGMYLGRTATVLAELIERSSGLISLDPNVRPTFVEDRASWDRWHERWIRQVSLYRCSDEDLAWIWPGRSIDSVAAELIDIGVEAVVVTKGAEGCEIFTPSWAETRRGADVKVVDTVGAGDTFTGGILFGLHERNVRTRASLASMDRSVLLEVADVALLAAAIVCGRQGADPPWRRELDTHDTTELPDTNGPPRST